jgi:hypothetical protein
MGNLKVFMPKTKRIVTRIKFMSCAMTDILKSFIHGMKKTDALKVDENLSEEEENFRNDLNISSAMTMQRTPEEREAMKT